MRGATASVASVRGATASVCDSRGHRRALGARESARAEFQQCQFSFVTGHDVAVSSVFIQRLSYTIQSTSQVSPKQKQKTMKSAVIVVVMMALSMVDARPKAMGTSRVSYNVDYGVLFSVNVKVCKTL